MQPLHKADDGRYAEKTIGKDRLAGSYAFRQLVSAGALVSFGSDWPVVSMNPFFGMDSAVNAETLAGQVWLPEHSLIVEEAMMAYTITPAKAVHREKDLGALEAGKLADVIVLLSDPLTMPKSDIDRAKPALVFLGGKIVYAPGLQ